MRIFRHIATLVVLSLGVYPRGAYAQESEYKVKAAFVYNFLKFTTYPGATTESWFEICVLGGENVQGPFSDLVGKQAQGREIKIIALSAGQSVRSCHVLFVSAQTQEQEAKLLTQVGSRPILTVGESDSFLQSGGLIRFVLDEKKIRFEVKGSNVERAGLSLSSKLLALAKSL